MSPAVTRRRFLAAASAVAATTTLSYAGPATRMKFAVTGVQLGWLSSELARDFDGTLRALASIGYRDVELVGDFGQGPRQLLHSLQAAGLRCVSNIFALRPGQPDLSSEVSKQLELVHALDLKYLVCMIAVPMGIALEDPWTAGPRSIAAAFSRLTLDDIKRMAELLNRLGSQAKKAGIRLAYHNLNYEFRRFDGRLGYDELLLLTDPELVCMEMDCGWLASSGEDPVRYLREHPGRFPLIHVKDVRDRDPNTVFRLNPVEVGRGIVDWPRVLTAAQASGVKIGYVEYEPSRLERPLLESAKICLDYLRAASR